MKTWFNHIFLYKGFLCYLETLENKNKKLMEIDSALNLKVRHYLSVTKKHKYIFVSVCKPIIWKSSGLYGII